MPLETDYTVPESAEDNTTLRCQRGSIGVAEHEVGRRGSIGTEVSKSYDEIKYWPGRGHSDPRHC